MAGLKLLALGGVGSIGRAALFDAFSHGSFDEIVVGDLDIARARKLIREVGDSRLGSVKVDAGKISELRQVVKKFDVVMNALPFKYDYLVTKACISVGVDGCDVSSTEEQLMLDGEARKKGITFVAGVGATPGITNIMTAKAADILEGLEEVKICWAAFRSTAPSPGLLWTTVWEFDPENHERVYFDNGFHHVAPFSGGEEIDFCQHIGRQMVYYVPHPETKTLPKSYPSLRRVEVKGTWPQETMNMLRFLLDYGFYASEDIRVRGGKARPLEFIQEVLLGMPQTKTTRLWCYGLYVEAVGQMSGGRARVVMRNSHPSMERWGVNAYYNNVGIPLSIGADLIAQDAVNAKGVLPPERAYNPDMFIQELGKREILIHHKINPQAL